MLEEQDKVSMIVNKVFFHLPSQLNSSISHQPAPIAHHHPKTKPHVSDHIIVPNYHGLGVRRLRDLCVSAGITNRQWHGCSRGCQRLDPHPDPCGLKPQHPRVIYQRVVRGQQRVSGWITGSRVGCHRVSRTMHKIQII